MTIESESAATDIEGQMVEGLLAEAEKANGGKPLDFGESDKTGLNDDPKPEEEKPAGEGEPGKEDEKPKGDPPPVEDYMAKAVDLAKRELKHLGDKLTDEQVQRHIHQRFLSGHARIQKAVESQKANEGRLAEFQSYYSQMEANEIVQAIRAGKKVQLAEEKPKADDDELMTDEMKAIKSLEGKINSLFESHSKRSEEDRRREILKATEEKDALLTEQIRKEREALSSRFPQFKAWLDQYQEFGTHTPEMEAILDAVERDNVTLTYAVANYFMEHGLPKVAEQARKETIAALQKKAGQKSESQNSLAKPLAKEMAYHDEDALAEHLVNAALEAGN